MPEVVQICYPGVGGQAAVATGLALEGLGRGVSQGILFYGVEPTAPQYLRLCDEARITHQTLVKKPGLGLAARRKLQKALDACQAKVVLAHHHDTAITASRVTASRAYALVFVEHHSNALKSRRDWLLSGMAHRCADHTVYLTPGYRDAVRARLGRWFKPAETSVIANGLDLSLYPGLHERAVGADEFVIGMQGRMDAGKDFATLLRAFAGASSVPATVPLRLELAGDGPDRQRLERLAAELGISGRVKFLGFVEHGGLIETMRSWDAAVLCTQGETLSMAILEAWALGLPLISNSVPGVGDLIRDKHDGLLVDPSQPALLTEAIHRLIHDAPLRRKLGKKGRKRVEDQFDRRTVGSQYDRLIRRLKLHRMNSPGLTTENPQCFRR